MSSQLYGKLDSEKKVEELEKARKIVNEITNFGVTQVQLLKIIYLLSLELENVDHMRAISSLVRDIEGGAFLANKQEDDTIDEEII
jgi:hypothetical protein